METKKLKQKPNSLMFKVSDCLLTVYKNTSGRGVVLKTAGSLGDMVSGSRPEVRITNHSPSRCSQTRAAVEELECPSRSPPSYRLSWALHSPYQAMQLLHV